MIHGHDVVVRRVLWDAAHVRPAVDVLGYRRLEKKTRDWYGHSKIPWVKEVAENVKLLREEAHKRYGRDYHHTDLVQHLHRSDVGDRCSSCCDSST